MIHEIMKSLADKRFCLLRYDPSPVERTYLQGIYHKGYYDGLDGIYPSVKEYNNEEAAVYAAGYVTGSDEMWNDID